MPKTPAPESSETRVEVHLKPFLGMRPGLYLTILYALIAIAVLFFLLFYKGLRDRGTFLRVSSSPPGAAVSIDGRYAGSTPCEVLVKRGTRTITASRPYFQEAALTDSFGGRVFGTLFVRPRRSWNATLTLSDSKELTASALKDFAANPHIPEILEQTARAVFGGGDTAQQDLSAFLDKSKYFITSPLQLKYFLTAAAFIESNGKVLTPGSLVDLVQNLALSMNYTENLPFWIAILLPENLAKKYTSSAWYQDFTKRYLVRLQELKAQARLRSPAPSSAVIRVGGLAFRGVPAGLLLAGSVEESTLAVQLPHAVQIPSLLVSESEVSNRQFRDFLDANPEWRKNNSAALAAKGWVNESYLPNWTEEGYPDAELPVTGVSYYAAEAFCRWLSGRLPSSLGGYEARLPSEAEWEWAARGGLVDAPYPQGAKPLTEVFFSTGITGPQPVGSSAPNGYGLRDMSGNVWEWCSDWYSPAAYLFTSWDPRRNRSNRSAEIPYGAEKAVRGGSWANEKELVKLYTRAAQPASWCTPYLGFRVALARP